MSIFGTVLGIWAHPDDETYLSAGLMTRAAELGDRVVCITATRGEAGSSDEDRWPAGPELANVRTAESDEAFKILGLEEHHWLDYPDGGCAGIDPSYAVARILAIASEVNPDLVVTFGPRGMTGHADHKAVHAWTNTVVTALPRTPKLWYAVHTDEYLAEHQERFTRLGAFMDGEPDRAAESEVILLQLTPEEHQRKWDALVAQASQTEAFFAAFGYEAMRRATNQEAFVEGWGSTDVGAI